MDIHIIELSNQEYWQDFFRGRCLKLLVEKDPTEKFSPGDKVQILNRDSIHSSYPFGRSYGKVKDILNDPDNIIPADMAVIDYQNFGFHYIFVAGFFGFMGLSAILSILGVI